MRRFMWAALAVLGIGLVVIGCASEDPKTDKVSVGQPAPEIEGKDQDGKPMKLSDYRGKVVLLDFWASWCGTCMELIPDDKKIADDLKGRPFAVVGVNVDDSPEVLKSVVKEVDIPWRNWNDADRTISRQWKARLLPTIYVIDHKGVVRYEFRVDKEPLSRLERKIRELVKEAEADGAKGG
jgi:peroxiredoxin